MTDSTLTPRTLLPGTLVRDNNSRVGRVAGAPTVMDLDGNPVGVYPVDFWGSQVKKPDNWLTSLAPDCPEALLVERPEALASWAVEAPLKLVALALSVDGGTGRVSDIRAKLSGRVIDEGQWENWWKKQPQSMRKMPDHFRISKVGKDNEYTLLTDVDAVDVAQETKVIASVDRSSAPASGWKNWLEAQTREPAPGRFPPRQVANSLARWPSETIEPVLFRLIVGAEEFIAARESSPQVAEGWLRAIAQAALRWRESGGSDPRGYTAARVGEVLARLAGIAGERTPQELLLQAGALDGTADAWRRGFLAGMWDSFEGDDARDIYLASATALGRQARGDLARQITLAAFGPDMPEHRHAELDRLLDALPEAQRTRLLNEVIASANEDQKSSALNYIAKSRHVAKSEQLTSRMVASLLLGGDSDFVNSVSYEMVDVLDQPENYGAAIARMFSEVRTKVQEKHDIMVDEILPRVPELERQLERERQEQERLRQQVRERNAELTANREESRLELRQDMLLAVGEVLQSVCRSDDSRATDNSVVAGLALALRAGGAEQLGTPGEVVEFNPEYHQVGTSVPERGRVKVVAPGVVYRGELHGDRVLLKAQVKHEAG